MKTTITWIIGASNGIGASLAEELAARGETIILSARSVPDLKAVKARLQSNVHHNRPQNHRVIGCDVADAASVASAVARLKKDKITPDRVIFMAGIYKPTALKDMDLMTMNQIVDVNLKGAFHVIYSILPLLIKRKRGQIVLCASVAGYRGLPNGQPYGATKAALINLAESLRAEVGKTLDIKVINPGFVETRLTAQNNFSMPFRISSEKAARAIANDLDKKRFEIHFPKRFTLIMKTLALLPASLYFKIMTR